MVSQGIGRFLTAATVWLIDHCAQPQQGSEKPVEVGVGVSINVGVASFPLTTTFTSFEMGNLAVTDVELEAHLTEGYLGTGCSGRLQLSPWTHLGLSLIPSSRNHRLRGNLSLYDRVDC